MCFLFVVNAEAGQKVGDSAESCPNSDKPKQEVPIHRELKRLIDAADCLIKRLSPEQRFLRDIVKVPDGSSIVARQNPSTNFLSGLVDNMRCP
jgi:hypothetical protein